MSTFSHCSTTNAAGPAATVRPAFARGRARRAWTLIVSLLLGFVLAPLSFAQGTAGSPTPQAFPYMVNPIEEAALTIGGLGLTGLAIELHKHKPPPDTSRLNPADIPPFDRLYTTTYSSWMSYASWGTMGVSLLVPAVDLQGMSAEQVGIMGGMYGETLLLAYGAKELVKSVVVRYRPYAYNPATSKALLSSSEVEDSFPSGHTVGAFAAATFAGYTYSQLNPNSPYQGVVWVTGLGLAGLTAILRVASGNHFASDALVGGVIGAAFGILVPWLHTQIQPIR